MKWPSDTVRTAHEIDYSRCISTVPGHRESPKPTTAIARYINDTYAQWDLGTWTAEYAGPVGVRESDKYKPLGERIRTPV